MREHVRVANHVLGKVLLGVALLLLVGTLCSGVSRHAYADEATTQQPAGQPQTNQTDNTSTIASGVITMEFPVHSSISRSNFVSQDQFVLSDRRG